MIRNDARALMIGLDSMSLPFARANLDALPVLKSLLGRGALIKLRSPGRLMSASMWTSFASGLDPGEHGHYHPFQWDAETMTFRRIARRVWSDKFAVEPFWHRLARAGVPSIVLDAGFVLHDEKAPCLQISNWSVQETGAATASDPAILSEIRRRFGRRPIGPEVPVPKTKKQSRKIRDQLVEAARRKADAIVWLMQQRNWRFFLAGFFETHRAGHNLWPVDGAFGSEVDPNALLDVYKEVDRQLGRVVDAASTENTTVIVFALHGMEKNRVQNHFLPQIMSRLNARYLEERGVRAKPRGGGGDVVSLARKLAPFNIQYALAKILGERVQDWVVNRGLVAGLDWPRTPAFHLASGGEGYLRLNVKGREKVSYFDPAGEEIDKYKTWLCERLLRIKVAGTDEKLIAEIVDARKVFKGARRAFLPDLILRWAPEAPVEQIHSPDIGDITERLTTGRGGNHTGDAFMLAIGEGARSKALCDVADIKDIGRFVSSLYSQPAISEPASRAPLAAEIA